VHQQGRLRCRRVDLLSTPLLDSPGTSGRFPEGSSKVPSSLGVVVRGFAPSSVVSCNPESSESDIVHDHVRPGQHQIAAITRSVIGIGAWYMEYAGPAEGRETVGCSSCRGELRSGGGSTKMISDGCPYANRKVLVQRVGKHLLPTAQAWRLGWPGLPVAAPGTGNRHIDLTCYLIPGQASVAQLQDLLCGGGMRWRTAVTHGDAGTAKLMTHGGPGNAQLCTDLAQTPTLGVQVGCTLNVHRATVTSHGRIVSALSGVSWQAVHRSSAEAARRLSPPSMNEPLSAKDLARDLATPRPQGLQKCSDHDTACGVGCLERHRVLVDGACERSRDSGRDEVDLTGAGECSLGALEPACTPSDGAPKSDAAGCRTGRVVSLAPQKHEELIAIRSCERCSSGERARHKVHAVRVRRREPTEV
jgi:hypothetical protein